MNCARYVARWRGVVHANNILLRKDSSAIKIPYVKAILRSFQIFPGAVKCSHSGNFQILLKIPIFCVHAPGNLLLDTIFWLEQNLAKRYTDDGPKNGAVRGKQLPFFLWDTFFPIYYIRLKHLFGRTDIFYTWCGKDFAQEQFFRTPKSIYLVGVAFQIYTTFFT